MMSAKQCAVTHDIAMRIVSNNIMCLQKDVLSYFRKKFHLRTTEKLRVAAYNLFFCTFRPPAAVPDSD